jgi:hypothetical protein
MNDPELRSVVAADIVRDTALGSDLLALNNAHAQELSWLEPERLEYLIGEAFLARRIGNFDAFLLAFDQDARYDSPNSSGTALAIRTLCMSTGSWSRHPPADAVARDGSMPICSNTPSAPGTTASSARSIPFRRTPLRTPSTRR